MGFKESGLHLAAHRGNIALPRILTLRWMTSKSIWNEVSLGYAYISLVGYRESAVERDCKGDHC